MDMDATWLIPHRSLQEEPRRVDFRIQVEFLQSCILFERRCKGTAARTTREGQLYTGRSPFTVTRVPARVCGQ
jgi:hypothetical protein